LNTGFALRNRAARQGAAHRQWP